MDLKDSVTQPVVKLEAGQSPEPGAILEQLTRILATNPFKNSLRYRSFLQHVVERTIEGRSNEIKERSIGVDVFGRIPGYDTTSDPVVRIAAGEVRRRLSQYYDDRTHEGELRITLPSGSYVPEFRAGEPRTSPVRIDLPRVDPPSLVQVYTETETRGDKLRPLRLAWILWLLLPAVVVGFAAGNFWSKLKVDDSPITRFWSPVFASSSPIIVSIGEVHSLYDGNHEIQKDELLTTPGTNTSTSSRTVYELLHNNTVAWVDAVTTSRLTGFVQARGGSFYLKRSELTSLGDLRQSAAILVGGYNNKWIMYLMSELRFSYYNVPQESVYWIRDREHPLNRSWSVNYQQHPSQLKQDFGIIARFWDPTTERPVVVASGIAAFGTLAAGEFLTEPKYMDMLSKDAPTGWQNRNMEIVFSAAIIDGNVGPPQILATHFW